MANERRDCQLGAEARDHVDMIGEHRDFMHMHCRPFSSNPNNFEDVARINSVDASRTQPGMPCNVGEDTKGSMPHVIRG